jgi:hypothetical protein
MRRLFFTLTISATLGLITACSGSPAPTAGFRDGADVLPSLSKSTLPSELLFVPIGDGTINIYPLKNPNKGGPIAQITGLIGDQQGMTVDASGNLFVVNNGGFGNDDFIAEFAPPYTSAPTIINTTWNSEVFFGIGIAVDASGTLYVSNCGAYCKETAAVYVYPAGSTSPTKAIASPLFSTLAGLGLDKHGNLFIVNCNVQTGAEDVFELPAGSTKPKPLHLHGLVTGNGGAGVTFDAAGNMYVSSNTVGSNYILVYKPGSRNAFRAIDGMRGNYSPTQIDVGPDGNLYVPIGCSYSPCTWVLGFKPGRAKPFESIGSVGDQSYTLGVATAPNPLFEGSKR